MKKSIIMLAFAGAAMLMMPACKKAETLITQNETATVAAGETYTYTLPVATNDAFEITSQAQHGTVSMIGTDASGNLIYTYVADANYTGTDEVVIATVEDKGHCKRPPFDSLHRMPPPPRDSLDSLHRMPPPPSDSLRGPRPPKHGKCRKENAVNNDYKITINLNVVPK